MTDYTYFEDITRTIESIPPDSIVSRTIYTDDGVRAVLFGFAAGQELTEHTASRPAVLHFVQGHATLTLGDDTLEAGPGTWVHMPAQQPHSIYASEQTVMLLLLLNAG
ncbi:MAG: cupin domain-containing protein [Anaerolineales bacterium]